MILGPELYEQLEDKRFPFGNRQENHLRSNYWSLINFTLDEKIKRSQGNIING